MTTPTPPVPADADRAFQSWADLSDSLHLCGSPDMEAMKFAFKGGAAWFARRILKGRSQARLRALERYQKDEYHLSTSGSGQSFADIKTLANWLCELAPGLPGGTEGKA